MFEMVERAVQRVRRKEGRIMRFEVKRNGITVFWTEVENCIPCKEEREMLRKSGHKLYKDGRIYKEIKHQSP